MKYISILFLMSFSVLCFGAMLMAMKSGFSYWRPDLIDRRSNPITFWFSVLIYAMLGSLFSAMALSILWLR